MSEIDWKQKLIGLGYDGRNGGRKLVNDIQDDDTKFYTFCCAGAPEGNGDWLPCNMPTLLDRVGNSVDESLPFLLDEVELFTNKFQIEIDGIDNAYHFIYNVITGAFDIGVVQKSYSYECEDDFFIDKRGTPDDRANRNRLRAFDNKLYEMKHMSWKPKLEALGLTGDEIARQIRSDDFKYFAFCIETASSADGNADLVPATMDYMLDFCGNGTKHGFCIDELNIVSRDFEMDGFEGAYHFLYTILTGDPNIYELQRRYDHASESEFFYNESGSAADRANRKRLLGIDRKIDEMKIVASGSSESEEEHKSKRAK